MYMVPPFLSYFGIIKSDQWWVAEGYRQIKYYRELLLDKSAGNLWKHILLGPNSGAPRNDEGHWSTGASRHNSCFLAVLPPTKELTGALAQVMHGLRRACCGYSGPSRTRSMQIT